MKDMRYLAQVQQVALLPGQKAADPSADECGPTMNDHRGGAQAIGLF